MNGNYTLRAMSHNNIQQILQIVVYLYAFIAALSKMIANLISNKMILLIVIGEIG
jgi:hypothetical protein